MLDAVLYRLLRKIKDFAERQAKKKPPCGDLIFILMVRRPDSLISYKLLISILFIFNTKRLYPHLYPQTKIRTKIRHRKWVQSHISTTSIWLSKQGLGRPKACRKSQGVKRTLLTSTFTNKQNKCFILKQYDHLYLLRSILQMLPNSKSFLTISIKSGMAFIDCCI